MKSLLLIVTLVSLSFVSKVNATPCFVISPGYPEAYEKASAVFIGKVVKIELLKSEARGPTETRFYRVTFNVEYSWKGAGFREFGLPELVVISEQVIKTAGPFYDCFPSPSFSEGNKYLVYADEAEDQNLTVGIANGSKPIWKASDDLKELKKRDALFARVKPRFF
jgi:hypothetical protein